MKWNRCLSSAIAMLLAAAPAVFAQRVTGSLRGTINDETGAALPGVSVDLESPELIGGVHTETTDIDGTYHFAALAPGTYKITASLDGFQTVILEGIRISVGTTTTQDVALGIAKIEESVTVTSEAPVVDVTRSGFKTNFASEMVKKLPIARNTYFDLVQSAPGIQSNDDNNAVYSSAFGSGEEGNSYQLDGVLVTGVQTGEGWPYPNYDVIKEVEFIGLGAPAEYGNYQGAVINVVTRSGGNEFHGDTSFYFQHDALTSNNTPGVDLPFKRDQYVDTSFQLGGPIKKDRIWFFASYGYRKDASSQIGTDPAYPATNRAHRVFGKLDAQISEAHKLSITYHDDYYEIPFEVSESKPFFASLLESGHNPTVNVLLTSVINSNTFVEVKYGGFFSHDKGLPATGSFEPSHYDTGTGFYTSGSTPYWWDLDQSRNQINVSLSHYADQFIQGNHDFKFGVQYQRAKLDEITGYSGGKVYYDYLAEPYAAYMQTPYHYGGDVNGIGVFMDDTWSVNNRLTLNLGVRLDRNTGSIPDFPELDNAGNETGRAIAGLGEVIAFTNVSPRLGATFKLDDEGRTVLRANYGRYYEPLITGFFDSATPAISTLYGYLYNAETGEYDDLFYVKDAARQVRIDGNLKNQYLDQFSAGFERQVMPNFGLGFTFVYKKTHDIIGQENAGATYEPVEYTDPETGQTITVFDQTNDPTTDNLYLITNPDGYRQEYKSFIITANKRMSDRWQMIASYQYEQSRGTSTLTNLRQLNSLVFRGVFGQDRNDLLFAYGSMQNEKPHVFKLQSTYTFPHEILFGANFISSSGRPYARKFRIADLAQGARVERAEERGARRLHRLNELDIRIEKSFEIGGGRQFTALLEVFNLFNIGLNGGKGVTDVIDNAGESFGDPQRVVLPRRAQIGFTFEF